MKRRLLAVLALLLVPGMSWAAPPKGFDSHVEAVREKLGAVGVAIAVVEDGKVTLAKGYGLKRTGQPAKVGPDTLFQIGSVSKAFTSAAIATLVDDGKLKWDDPVIDHLPDFRMYDPWVTREMTVRDLLVHRSGLGLGQGDLMMVPATNISRAEVTRRMRYLKPATSFRSAYAYDNVLYVVAGQLIEQVSGQTWEDYVRDRLLRPAGMANSVTNDPDRWAARDRALPHGKLGLVRGTGPLEAFDEKGVSLSLASAPAGAIASSANDMAKWLQVQLADGRIPGSDKPLFSKASHREMWSPVVPMAGGLLPGVLGEASPQFKNYALGWNVQDYRGHKIIIHGGATLGFRAGIVLVPEKNVGFAMMINSEENSLIPGLQYELLDHYLGLPKRDWSTAFADFLAQRDAEAVKALDTAKQEKPQTKPSLPLAAYAGTYADPWYGRMAIREDGKGGLTIDFLQTPSMKGPLEHWTYDTFIVRWSDPGIEPAYVTFSLGADGKPERIAMKAVSPTADFSFDYQDLAFTPVAAN